MMTSINPKNSNLGNIRSNEGEIITNPTNNLFQRNKYKEEYNDEIMENNIKFKENSNINFNMNDKNYNQQLNSFKGLNNKQKNSEDIFKNADDYSKMNANNQNNSINLNLGLHAKKNYSTPILNEASPEMNQEMNYNKSFDMYEKNQINKNRSNLNQPENFNQNKNDRNNEYYLAEIEELKKEINNLKSNNEYLNNQLIEEQRKNEQLFSIQKAKDENESSLLSEISHCLQVSSFEEILPKLNEIINYLNNNVNNSANQNSNKDSNNKIRDELISKIQNLYLSLTGSNERKEEITIKILWRWIKHLINTVKQLALEKEKNLEMYQNMQEVSEYKDYCEELIYEFNLQSLEELKMFIDNLLKQNNIIINQRNENQQQELRNIPMRQMPMAQQQFKMQNYQEDENDEGEAEGEVEGGAEGEEEVDENENIDPNQQQYEKENEYDENNEMIQKQMEINKQIPGEGNYNFKYDENINQGNEY